MQTKPLYLIKWTKFFCPVNFDEYKKFFLFGALACTLALVSAITSNFIGNAVTVSLINAYKSSAIVNTLKSVYLVPFSIIYAFIYIFLLVKVGRAKAFFYTFGASIGYIVFYHFSISPPTENSATSQTISAWNILVTYFPHTLMYLITESIKFVAIPLYFFQLANESHTSEQSKRLYPLYFIATMFTHYLSMPLLARLLGTGSETFYNMGHIVLLIMGTLLSIILYKKSEHFSNSIHHPTTNKSAFFDVLSSIKLMFTHPVIRNISLIFLIYQIPSKIIESFLKNEISLAFTTKASYSAFWVSYSYITSGATILFLFISGHLLQKENWKKTFSNLPIWLSGLGTALFAYALIHIQIAPAAGFLGFNLSLLNLMILAVALLFFKGAGLYVILAKEVMFTGLPQHPRERGKPLVDIIASKTGNISSVFASTMALVLYFYNSPFYTLLIFLTSSFMWYFSARQLTKKIEN